jgi:hypothetical protein
VGAARAKLSAPPRLPFGTQVAQRALQAGKHVMLEKPAGPSAAAALRVLAAHRALPRPPVWLLAENYRCAAAAAASVGLPPPLLLLLLLYVALAGLEGRVAAWAEAELLRHAACRPAPPTPACAQV